MRDEAALDGFYGALLDHDAEALYDRAPCGYLSTTPDGTIITVNQTFLTLTGYGRAELVGRRTFAELLTVGGRIFYETHYAPMLRMEGAVRGVALDVVRADGGRLHVLVNAVLERDADGAPTVVRAAVFDATERREYERELLAERRRAEESEARARLLVATLQRTLVPPELPDVPGLDVAGAYRPAGDGEEVGGDLYDLFEVAPDDWVAVIGDVQGKGVDAAVVTALIRYTVRAAAVRHSQPSGVLTTLNEVLVRDDTDRLCTVAVVRLRRSEGTWTATVSSAGHPPPLLTALAGAPTPVGSTGGLIGAFPGLDHTDTEVPLAPGDTLVLYTDGVTEARGADGWYGEARLRDAVARHAPTAHALTDALLDEVLAFQDGLPRDDIAVLTVRVP